MTDDKRWISWSQLERPSAIKVAGELPRLPESTRNREASVPTPKVLYEAKCGHIVSAVAGKATVECNEDGMQPVTGVHVFEWRSRCKSCTFARWCGLSRRLAEYLANQHSLRRPTHLCGVEYMRNPISQRVLEKLIGDRIIT